MACSCGGKSVKIPKHTPKKAAVKKHNPKKVTNTKSASAEVKRLSAKKKAFTKATGKKPTSGGGGCPGCPSGSKLAAFKKAHK